MIRALYLEYTIEFEILINIYEQNMFIDSLKKLEVTDVYIYITNDILLNYNQQIKILNKKLNFFKIRPWILNGDRTHIDVKIDPEASGPQELYDQAQNLVIFNKTCDISEKFYGFILDIEVPDIIYGDIFYRGFHNCIPDILLSKKIGSGIFPYTSQFEDRNNLLCNWLEIHSNIKNIISQDDIKLSCALSNWTENYFGGPVKCTYNNITQNWFYHICDIMDEISIMTYSNTIETVKEMGRNQLIYADKFMNKVKITFAIETNNYGVNDKISFGSLEGMNVITLIEILEKINKDMFKLHYSYNGVSIYDYSGITNLKN